MLGKNRIPAINQNNYKSIPDFLYGSIHFDDYRNIDGILIPFKQTVQIGAAANVITDYVHQLLITDFKWDNFTLEEIPPLKNIKHFGNTKPKNE